MKTILLVNSLKQTNRVVHYIPKTTKKLTKKLWKLLSCTLYNEHNKAQGGKFTANRPYMGAHSLIFSPHCCLFNEYNLVKFYS